MKRLFLLLFLLPVVGAKAQKAEAFFLSNPCLTPDGQMVIFSFEGDLWKAGIKGGSATRLTAMQSYETNPRVSPDGRWVAFTGRQYGNADVFVMPAEGGEIRQLTYGSTTDDVNSWSWDSKTIYFSSGRKGNESGFKVSLTGGTAQRVFGNYFFQYDHNLFEHPTTGEIFFNDTWESSNQVQRKRYKGPFNPDIQSYNPATRQYKKYTDWQGKDFGATIDKNGNIFFISDEQNGEYNLYTFDKGKKTALTRFSSSIKSPQVTASGDKVVFEKDYQLWVYDVKAAKSSPLEISIIRNPLLPKEKDLDVRSNITYFDVSPDGKKMAFVARGEIFVSDADCKFIQQLKRGSAERVKEVKWMSDNKTLLFSQTVEGYTNWFTAAADGSTALKQLTSDKKNNRSASFDSKRSQLVYLSGRDEVRLLDTKTGQSKSIIKDEIWGFQNSDPSFSPDGEWVAFTAIRNFEQDIFVYHIKDGKTINLTNTSVTEAAPQWSPDGKYLYCMSSRLRPAYPLGLQNPHVYSIPLEKLDAPYKLDKFNELFKEEKKDTGKKAVTPATAIVSIDPEQIMERLELIGPSFGSQELVKVLKSGEKTIVLYSSNHSEGKSSLWKTVLEPFETPKTEKIAGADAGGFDVVEASGKYYALFNGNLYKLNLDMNRVDPISISYTFRRNLQAEFSQVFEEAWAQVEENYYDEKFHGLDWNKTKAYYSRFIPYLNNRADLRILLNDMLGELNSSHQGFATFGDDEAIALSNRTMETGIVFDNSEPYKISYIVKRSAADRKSVTLLPGDELVSVNGEAVDKKRDRDYYFTRPSLDNELRLTFNRGTQMVEVKIHPQPSLFNNLYDEWIDNNQQRVNEKSKKRIAYSCMKNMGTPELEKFIIDMTQELTGKDGLILDLRYNTGGNVHDDVLRFLSQRSYLQWKYREGQLTPQSNFGPSDKPIVLLINEQSLSDAEMTAQGFKALKLGTIIGNETYHWIIFTSGVGMVDGSFVRMPAWGCYTLEGKDLELNGVQPDIKVINTFEDRINNRDPQLDRAIEEIMKKINK